MAPLRAILLLHYKGVVREGEEEKSGARGGKGGKKWIRWTRRSIGIFLIDTQLQGERERAAWPWCAHSKREDNHSKMSTHDSLKHARLIFTYRMSARMSDYLYTHRMHARTMNMRW